MAEEGQSSNILEQRNYKYVKYSYKNYEYFVRVNLEGYIVNGEGEVEEVMAKVLNNKILAIN